MLASLVGMLACGIAMLSGAGSVAASHLFAVFAGAGIATGLSHGASRTWLKTNGADSDLVSLGGVTEDASKVSGQQRQISTPTISLPQAAAEDSAERPASNSEAVLEPEESSLRDRLSLATEAAGICTWELDLKADRFLWTENWLAALEEGPPNGMVSANGYFNERFHPEDAQIFYQTVATTLRAKRDRFSVRYRVVTAQTGRYIHVLSQGRLILDKDRRASRMLGASRDITREVEAHEELVQATQAAQAANTAKSAFLANVSHEIRTPMNGIIGMTQLLLDTTLDRTQQDYAQTIRGSADSLLIVINDLLDFSKIEAGKLSIEAIEMDLRGNLEDVGTMMAFQAAAKNLELIINVHPDVAERVIGDPQRIRQCLINLVGNAIKFTRVGEVLIEAKVVARRDGKALTRFEVRDTGMGIAPEVLQRLFQPFVQADTSTTRHFGGTGLGLSIVSRLAEMMGGEVGVESVLGSGSTFWFTLPLTELVTSAPAEATAPHRLGRRVLVVDDRAMNRQVLSTQLSHAGYDVSEADCGTGALQMLRQGLAANRPYDLILADYQMHDMDGAALGEQVNSDPHLSRARIVILTSLDRQGDVHRFASLGFAGYLTKPVRSRELFDCIDRVLARESREWQLQTRPIVTPGALLRGKARACYKGSVLLVEDNAVNQKVALRILERMGCNVRIAEDGEKAVEACRESSFDLVLMDLQMPVMDGYDATRHIRELETGRRTPIIALSANAMTGQLERCLEADMDGFLTKPLEIPQLCGTLERYGFAQRHADSLLTS